MYISQLWDLTAVDDVLDEQAEGLKLVTWTRTSPRSLADGCPSLFSPVSRLKDQPADENDNKHEDEFLSIHLLLSHDAAPHVEDQPQ